MQTVVHVLHHIEPKVIEFLYHALFTAAGLVGAVVFLNLIIKCCSKR